MRLEAVHRHPLLAYFGLTWAISWLLWLPAVASRQGWWEIDVPIAWHYAGAVGPITAAIVVAFIVEGQEGVLALAQQYRPSRASLPWLVGTLGGMLVLFGAGLTAARLADGEWPAYEEVANAGNLPALGLPLTFLVHLVTFGIGEETGWRGFALPRLQEQRSAARATALLFVGWSLWHVPSFFENPDYTDMNTGTVVGWAIGLALGAVFLTWLYNSTRGSLLTIVLWHATFNTITASEAASGALAAVATTGIMAMAVVVFLLAGPAELRGWSRRAGPRVGWRQLGLEAEGARRREAATPASGVR
ncbi:MAG TPA: type II CAAX endopeptidase family protein [Dehalococcoidia bacterium]|nr:type II CAAX endopeptidase family protein [Dehalococcoidia bacterium]